MNKIRNALLYFATGAGIILATLMAAILGLMALGWVLQFFYAHPTAIVAVIAVLVFVYCSYTIGQNFHTPTPEQIRKELQGFLRLREGENLEETSFDGYPAYEQRRFRDLAHALQIIPSTLHYWAMGIKEPSEGMRRVIMKEIQKMRLKSSAEYAMKEKGGE